MIAFRLLVLLGSWLVFSSVPGPSPARAAEVIPVQDAIYDDLNNLSIDVDIGLGFNMGPDGTIRCNFLLDGPITGGDLDRVKSAIGPFASRAIDKTPRLCLNSTGGSWNEGLAIARYLMDENIGTAVPANAICYSACSIIFMGGTFPWKGEINRFLHVLGDVGFHAPYVRGLPDDAYNAEAVSQAFSEGTNAIRALMKLGVGNKVQRFPADLMAEMLEKGPEELFSIDTVGRAIRYRVHLYGAKPAAEIGKRELCNVCVNQLYGAFENYGTGGENDFCATDAAIEEETFPEGKRLVSDLAPRGGTCEIDVTIKNGKPTAWAFVDFDAQWGDGLELAHWYLVSPSVLIKTLYDGKADLSLARADGSPAVMPAPPRQESGGTSDREAAELASALEDFIRNQYLGHGKTNHVTPDSLFAREVDYYDKGRIPRAAVAADHASYYRKWPERRYELIADSLAFRDAGNGLEASFRFAFEIANAKKRVTGTGQTTIVIQRGAGGRFEIVRENGEVVSRK